MIRPINKNPLFLSIKSTDATLADLPVAKDLSDTLAAHADECVGLAANMIGVSKRIIAFADQTDGLNKIMLNPVITSKKGHYMAEEGCLSLPGERKASRWNEITVEYTDTSFMKHNATFTGFTAQIIQHEIDMTNGILI